MLVYSFAEVAWSAPMFYTSIKNMVLSTARGTMHKTRTSSVGVDEDEDPALPHEQIPTWQWTCGLLLSSIGTLVVGKSAL